MTTPSVERWMTAEELAALPEDGHRYELSRGRLICMSPSSTLPGIVASNLLVLLGGFVRSQRMGVCGTADSGLRLATDPDTVRAPDVWFISAGRLPAVRATSGFWDVAPDLAVEVLSPSDRWAAVLAKVAEYLEAGTRLVWVLNPLARSAIVFRADGSIQLHGADGTLDGEDVLPGFALRLIDVWA